MMVRLGYNTYLRKIYFCGKDVFLCIKIVLIIYNVFEYRSYNFLYQHSFKSTPSLHLLVRYVEIIYIFLKLLKSNNYLDMNLYF